MTRYPVIWYTLINIRHIQGEKMRLTALALAAMMIVALSCKKNEQKIDEESVLARKCAKFSAPVYKNSDLNEWQTTLAKAEFVNLLDSSEEIVKNKKKTVAKVRLSDDTVGYIDMEYLAERPIVFLKDTRAHDRNNITSKVYMTVPKGTIAFIVAEKGDWAQLYAGKLQGKFLSKQWVQGGFSTEENLIIEARDLEDAVAALESDESTDEARQEAVLRLQDIARASAAFGDLARNKLTSLKYQTSDNEDADEGNVESTTAQPEEEE